MPSPYTPSGSFMTTDWIKRYSSAWTEPRFKSILKSVRVETLCPMGVTPEWEADFHEEQKILESQARKAGWKKGGEGRHRRALKSPDGAIVAKMSMNGGGVQANLFEWLSSAKGTVTQITNLEIQIPKVLGFFQGDKVSVLFVEKVRHTGHGFSEETLALIDGYQTGRTKDGRIVVYDWCPF